MHGSAWGGFAFGGGENAVASLEFDGQSSPDYLSMSSTDFGDWSGNRLAIAGSLFANDNTSVGIISRLAESTGNATMLFFTNDSQFNIRFNDSASNTIGDFRGGSLQVNTWNSFLIHFNGQAASSSNRLKLWVNDSEVTPAFYNFPGQAQATSTPSQTLIGSDNGIAGTEYYDGLMYSIGFFNNSLPAPAQIFNGSAGKLRPFSGITGLQSWLTGGSAVADGVRVADWTNNGDVSVNSSVP
jgi:hypothetical protein